MEKIRKALDLARAERTRLGVEPPVATLAEPPAVATLAEPADGAEPLPFPGTAKAMPPPRARVFTPDPGVLEDRRVLQQNSTSPAAEAFRLLRTQVLQRMEERNWRTLAIVSPGDDESRLEVAANLAAGIGADRRYHALLVDLDLRAPRLAELYGLQPEHGVDDVLAGAAAVEDCLYRPDGFERLVLLPARRPLARGSELLASPASRRLAGELRDRYPDRLVVCNLAPVLASDEALAFVPHVDCALVVVTESRTRRAELARAMDLLRRVPVVGTVLGNAAALKRSRE